MRKLNPVISLVAVLALLAAGVALFWPGQDKKLVTASFPRTVSLYEGSEVKILGVAVGKVDSVVPTGTDVTVKFHYDAQHKVPADAQAVVVSPSIVGDRFIQLTPAYTEGAVLPDGARLGLDRTSTPLELDEIFGSINDLSKALGPDGANKADAGGVGPLTRLLDSTARNLGGQGVTLNQTLKDVGALTQTLDDNKDAFFSSVTQIEDFTSTLAASDQTVRQFNDSLASGAELLAGEREELAAVLKNLSIAVQEVRTFVAENRDSLSSNIDGLNRISTTLVKRRDALDQILRTAPAALNNLFLAGNTDAGTLDVRANVGQTVTQLTRDPATVLCTFVAQAPGGRDACGVIQQALAANPLGRTAALQDATPTAPLVVEPIDRSLGGLLEVTP